MVANQSDLAKLTLWHHIIGVSGLVMSLYAGYGYPVAGAISLLAEASTIFLNFREM